MCTDASGLAWQVAKVKATDLAVKGNRSVELKVTARRTPGIRRCRLLRSGHNCTADRMVRDEPVLIDSRTVTRSRQ